MASQQEIKSRLTSVVTTKKITKAMQLVATAKLQRARKELGSIQEYYTSVYEMFQDLLSSVSSIAKLSPANPKDSDLYILLTSDIGLCGGYNSNVIKVVKSVFRAEADKIIVLGNKGISSLKTLGFTPTLKFGHVGDHPNYNIAVEIAREALAQFKSGNVRSVNLVYTKFINTVTTEATNLQLLPITIDSSKKTKSSFSGVTEFEPSPEEVLKNAIPLYISSLVYGSMMESKVSEMSSRRTAMENATENAEELIDTLDLEYNRMRQAAVTQEISEIVAGSETE